jgi:hypothetical protein
MVQDFLRYTFIKIFEFYLVFGLDQLGLTQHNKHKKWKKKTTLKPKLTTITIATTINKNHEIT